MLSGTEIAIESDLLRHLDAGDLEAVATGTLRAYGPEIFNYLKLIFREGDAAYEIFAQFGEDLWRSLGSFRRQCSFKTWAYLLACRAAFRHDQEAAERPETTLHSTFISKIPDGVRTTIMGHAKIEVVDRLARIRQRLSPAEQTLLTLRFDRGFSWAEVAQIMSEMGHPVDEALVRKRFQRLRHKLRELAQGEGL
jgi:RNA polymerase sigma-70 factor (ECF subfamily)